jgi:hypothetical protein
MTAEYDLVFVGNASLDEIHTYACPMQTLFGGGVAFSAMAAVWTGKKIAVVTRPAAGDNGRLEPLRAAGVAAYATYDAETTRHLVHHLSADVDQRQVLLTASAGPPGPEELDPVRARDGKRTLLHVAALTDRESSVGFLKDAVSRGDTTFGSYLACRLDEDVAGSLRWAAAVASMKLE